MVQDVSPCSEVRRNKVMDSKSPQARCTLKKKKSFNVVGEELSTPITNLFSYKTTLNSYIYFSVPGTTKDTFFVSPVHFTSSCCPAETSLKHQNSKNQKDQASHPHPDKILHCVMILCFWSCVWVGHVL